MAIAEGLPPDGRRQLLVAARTLEDYRAGRPPGDDRTWLMIAPGGQLLMMNCTADCPVCMPETCPKLRFADTVPVGVNIIGGGR